MRMQPCEALWPIEASSEVPWMPTPSKIPSQRALIGLVGSSPGMTLPARSPAHALLGTCQAGLMALFCDRVLAGRRLQADLPDGDAVGLRRA